MIAQRRRGIDRGSKCAVSTWFLRHIKPTMGDVSDTRFNTSKTDAMEQVRDTTYGGVVRGNARSVRTAASKQGIRSREHDSVAAKHHTLKLSHYESTQSCPQDDDDQAIELT